MEADLAFRGMDLRDFWTAGGGPGRLSMRRLFVLLRGLPAESVTHAYLRREREQVTAAHRKGRFDHYKGLKARQEAARGGS